MTRYIVSKSPVRSTRTGAILGFTIRLSDGTSYFEQTKRVPRGHAIQLRTWR